MDEGKKLTLLPKHCQFRHHGWIWAVEAMLGGVLTYRPRPFTIFRGQPIAISPEPIELKAKLDLFCKAFGKSVPGI